MIDLNIILDEWDEDSKINRLDLGEEAIRNSTLHAKYVRYVVQAKSDMKRAEKRCKMIMNKKIRYFRGMMTKEELQAEGWHQYQGIKPLKGELYDMVDRDEDYMEAETKHNYYKTTVEALESILKEISAKGFNIKNAIDWHKWTSGG